MPYAYDVFFSYKRNVRTRVWYEGLKDKLEYWLGEELQREARIFFDTEDISTGMRWRQKLEAALNVSSPLLPGH